MYRTCTNASLSSGWRRKSENHWKSIELFRTENGFLRSREISLSREISPRSVILGKLTSATCTREKFFVAVFCHNRQSLDRYEKKCWAVLINNAFYASSLRWSEINVTEALEVAMQSIVRPESFTSSQRSRLSNNMRMWSSYLKPR